MMTEQEAGQIRNGDTIIYQGQPHVVTGIKVAGIAAPHFRLAGVRDGLTSYRLCSLPPQAK